MCYCENTRMMELNEKELEFQTKISDYRIYKCSCGRVYSFDGHADYTSNFDAQEIQEYKEFVGYLIDGKVLRIE